MAGRCTEGLREIKVKRWRQEAVDRERWAYVIKEVKDLRGPWSQAEIKQLKPLKVQKYFLPNATRFQKVHSFF